MEKFKQLLDNPENNVLVDIHSCANKRYFNDGNPEYENFFTRVPRGIYLVLISDFGRMKIGDEDVQHIDRKMYSNSLWPWKGDYDVINTAQIYFPGDRIFNPEMMFGEPGEDDEFFNIFNVMTGAPYKSFNKTDPKLVGNEKWKTYTRATVLGYLRSYTPKIVYIATCDPIGDKPSDWTVEKWRSLKEERQTLQYHHRNKFRDFQNTYNDTRISSRQRGVDPSGRSVILGRYVHEDHEHFVDENENITPHKITAVSKYDNQLECISECDYKDSCINNIPGLGNLIKSCQNKYCDFADGTNGICIDYNNDVEGGIINLRTSASPRTPRSRNRKKRQGGKRKLKKKKTKRRKTRTIKRKKRKTRKHKKKSRKTKKKYFF